MLGVRITGWVSGYETGQIVPVVAVRAPDFADREDVELFELACRIEQLRRLPRLAELDRDEQDELIREAIRESRRFAGLAHLDPLPELDLTGAGEITLMEAQAFVEEGLAEEVGIGPGELDQEFEEWLDTPGGRFARWLADHRSLTDRRGRSC